MRKVKMPFVGGSDFVDVDDINSNDVVFAVKDNLVVGMLLQESSKTYVLRCGKGSDYGRGATVLECLQAGTKMYNFKYVLEPTIKDL